MIDCAVQLPRPPPIPVVFDRVQDLLAVAVDKLRRNKLPRVILDGARPRRADVSCCQDHRHRDQQLTLGYRARRDSLGCLAQRLHHLRVQARRRGQDQSSAPSRVAVVLLLANRHGACQPCHFCAVSFLLELALHTKYQRSYFMQPTHMKHEKSYTRLLEPFKVLLLRVAK